LLRWAKPRPQQASEPQTAPAIAGDEVILPEIAGINIADGVKRVAGNKRLYRDLLMQFATKQSDASAEILAALASGDLKLAERIAHTVKGVAGNIGIVDVQSAAQNLEKAIREDQNSVPALLDVFAESLSHQVHAIKHALHESEPAKAEEAPPQPFNGQAATDAIARLRNLLEASDGSAEEAFHSLHDAVSGTVDKRQLDMLGASINDFDFEAALVKLDEIAKVCTRNGDESK
jgi:HPt (histidine-containing phosphotransfer) domain-containing protein